MTTHMENHQTTWMASQLTNAVLLVCLLMSGCDGNKEADSAFIAARSGDSTRLVELVQSGVSPDVFDDDARTLLFVAVESTCVDCVKSLLDLGANPNLQSGRRRDERQSPLAAAVSTNDNKLVALLLNAGASMKSREMFDVTPLEMAANSGSPAMIELFLERKTVLTRQDLSGAIRIARDRLNREKSPDAAEVLRLLTEAEVQVR